MTAHRKQTSHTRHTKSGKSGRQATNWLRTPISIPRGRKLRVLLYGRYSTDEQNHRSIADQVAYCREFLQSLKLADIEYEILSDEAISGEIVSRPGINRVFAGCQERQWDVVMAEDASRLYRHETACGELIETAVDEGIRVICINDYLDTDQEDWEDRLHEALRHHAKANHYTSRRIKRAHSALWGMGAAIGMLKPGYIRKPTTPATETEPAKGPFFDEVDQKWAPTIVKIYEWITAGDAPQTVAERVTAAGLPKSVNAKYSNWTENNILSLIRRPDYRGFQTFRDTISKKKYRTGKRRQVANDADEVLPRDMPHLRVVPDHLWIEANRAIDDRISTDNRSSGAEHPLWGIPRDSRMPLSRILVCGICGERTHVIGANGYRCRNTTKRARPGTRCWNRASVKTEVAHDAMQRVLQKHLERLTDAESCKIILESVNELLDGDGQPAIDRDNRRLELQAEKLRLETALENLLDVAEKTGAAQQDSLGERIQLREDELVEVQARLEHLKEDKRLTLTENELSQSLEEFGERLQRFERELQGPLQQVLGTVEAVPHQQFGSNKVVLRGRGLFQPIQLLPAKVRLALNEQCEDRLSEMLPEILQPITISVDLFESPQHIRYLDPIVAANQCHDKLSLKKLAAILPFKVNYMTVKRTCDYHRQMEEAGVTDPYQVLEAPPVNASRWKLDD